MKTNAINMSKLNKLQIYPGENVICYYIVMRSVQKLPSAIFKPLN